MKSSMDTTCENLFQCCSFVQIVLAGFLSLSCGQAEKVLPPSSLLLSGNSVCLSPFVISLPQFRIYVQHLGRDDSYVVLIFNFINNILRAIASKKTLIFFVISCRLIKFARSDS